MLIFYFILIKIVLFYISKRKFCYLSDVAKIFIIWYKVLFENSDKYQWDAKTHV